jgi:enoyl-CoA hydratase/carnithine racemase
VIAAEDTRFSLIEGRLGHPGATEIVPLVGAAWAKYVMLTGEIIDAPEYRLELWLGAQLRL